MTYITEVKSTINPLIFKTCIPSLHAKDHSMLSDAIHREGITHIAIMKPIS